MDNHIILLSSNELAEKMEVRLEDEIIRLNK
jgi:hypothetical protein